VTGEDVFAKTCRQEALAKPSAMHFRAAERIRKTVRKRRLLPLAAINFETFLKRFRSFRVNDRSTRSTSN
jgi:hypothetical protein